MSSKRSKVILSTSVVTSNFDLNYDAFEIDKNKIKSTLCSLSNLLLHYINRRISFGISKVSRLIKGTHRDIII